MPAPWKKVYIPPLERMVLAEVAERHGETDVVTLARLIREAGQRELGGEPQKQATPDQSQSSPEVTT